MKIRAATLALLASASYCYADQTPEACSALRDTVFSGGFVTSARVMSPEGLPQYCEVRATALPAISIEVRLPSFFSASVATFSQPFSSLPRSLPP